MLITIRLFHAGFKCQIVIRRLLTKIRYFQTVLVTE